MASRKQAGRTTLRVAAQIRKRLAPIASGARLVEPPEDAWERLDELAARLKLVLSRDWSVASQVVLEDLEYAVRRLQRELDTYRGQLPMRVVPRRIASYAEIAADLAALPSEFSEVQLDLSERCVSVVTDPVELEGVDLGRFRIELHWDRKDRTRAFEVIALEPVPAAENQAVTHPHVYDGSLCAGEGALPIQAALTEGRLCDFFLLVNQILHTYNAGSAHVPLERWTGAACRDCGEFMTAEEQSACDRCDKPLCYECSLCCSTCDRNVCDNCCSECTHCGERFCTRCLTDREAIGRLLCTHCLDQSKETTDDPTHAAPADGPSAGQEPAAEVPQNNTPCPSPL